MGKRSQRITWTQLLFWGILFAIVIIPLTIAVVSFFQQGNQWPQWTGFAEIRGPTNLQPNQPYERAKTLWDVLNLLIIPVSLVVITTIISQFTEGRERRLEVRRSHDAALQAYLDQMTVLLLQQNLAESAPGSKERKVAKVRTDTVLRMLNGQYRSIVLKFLYDTHLIDKPRNEEELDTRPVISLEQSNLQDVALSGALLDRIDLSNASLRDATLHKAYLERVVFQGCDLEGVDLSDSILRGANLSNAILRGTDLRNAVIDDSTLFVGAKADRRTKWPNPVFSWQDQGIKME